MIAVLPHFQWSNHVLLLAFIENGIPGNIKLCSTRTFLQNIKSVCRNAVDLLDASIMNAYFGKRQNIALSERERDPRNQGQRGCFDPQDSWP